jgi:hypothetical protein
MWVIPSAVLISWESWKRRHDAGIMNFRGGNWYGVFVVNMTGIEGGRDPSMSIVELKVDWIHAARSTGESKAIDSNDSKTTTANTAK